ncbi:MAG: sigma 54-interacting transcriptional regulator [Myxococcales bacterium]|nr:sigma 54-interacting transcriptional regulator [Myxococcales bacterium]
MLLLGETGAGEPFARLVHSGSPSAPEGPSSRSNCGAVPGAAARGGGSSATSGAFTGAERACRGLLRRGRGRDALPRRSR